MFLEYSDVSVGNGKIQKFTGNSQNLKEKTTESKRSTVTKPSKLDPQLPVYLVPILSYTLQRKSLSQKLLQIHEIRLRKHNFKRAAYL